MSQQLATNPYPSVVDVTQKQDGTYVKAFLIDDTINQNFWHIPDEHLQKYVYGFEGRPLIKHPEGEHVPFLKEGVKDDTPTFIQDALRHQERYRIGDIIKVEREPMKDNPAKNAYFAYIRLTKPESIASLKEGASGIFVSPLVYDLDHSPVGQPTKNFIPMHLAVVNKPAYGSKANFKGVCNGTGKVCLNSLKEAALKLVNEIDHNSSYFKNSGNSDHNLTNPTPNNNQILDQVQANTQFNPNLQYGYAPNTNTSNNTQGQPSTIPQILSEKKEVKEVDSEGNVVTKVEDKKKGGKTEQLPNPLTNNVPNPENPQVPQQTDFQLPKELLEKLNNIDVLQKQVEELTKYKQTAEEKQLKEASEAQRAMVEQSFAHVQDPQAKQEIVDYLVGLNLQDEDLQKIIQAIVTGQFSTSADQPQQNQSAAPAGAGSGIPTRGSGFPKKQSAIKGASVLSDVADSTLRINNDASSHIGFKRNNVSMFDNGIDWESLL